MALCSPRPERKRDLRGLAESQKELVKELGMEANTPYMDEAYRSGAIVSILTLIRFFVKSLLNSRSHFEDGMWTVPRSTLAFSMFKNERAAIEEHIQNGAIGWSHVQLDITRATGLDFLRALFAGMAHLRGFFVNLIRQYGFKGLRRFAYPFIGYCVYFHLRKKFRAIEQKGTVVTTNMIHPVSLAIHYAAKEEGWDTIFLEHAMTPRLVAKDRGYTKLFLRSEHTREMFAEEGIPRQAIEVLSYWSSDLRPARLDDKPVKNVGIAVNNFDAFSDIEFLAEAFSKQGMHCQIRVHDADKRLDAFRALGTRVGAVISSAASSDIMDFLVGQDVIIVGNSSVLLDCLRAQVPAVYFWSGASDIFDYYGLATYMRFPSARNRQEVLDLLASTAGLPESN